MRIEILILLNSTPKRDIFTLASQEAKMEITDIKDKMEIYENPYS